MKLDGQDHSSLALWAADCAWRVLPYFEGEHPGDDRPRRAIEAGRAWARGEIRVGEARAAAREADGVAACAARAAGHAAATAHMAAHARHAAGYAARAVAHAAAPAGPDDAPAGERDLQYRGLPEHLRPVAFPDR
jgi:hypothetical protein